MSGPEPAECFPYPRGTLRRAKHSQELCECLFARQSLFVHRLSDGWKNKPEFDSRFQHMDGLCTGTQEAFHSANPSLCYPATVRFSLLLGT